MKKLKKQIFTVALLGVMSLSLTACNGGFKEMTTNDSCYEEIYLYADQAGAEGYPQYDMVTESTMDNGMSAESGMGELESANKADVTTNRKLIRTVTMEVETEDFDSMITNVEERVRNMGGYIENAYSFNGSAYQKGNTRYAEMTVRVPDSELENFIEQVKGFSNIVSKTTSTQDITLEYVDTEGLRDMYLAEEASLLALLEKAESVEDIVYLTSRLSEVRYNIENMESRLLKYDNLVDYATIHLSIEEVEVYTPVETQEKTFAEEVKEGFSASVQDIVNSFVRFVKNLLIDLPYIIRFFVVIGIIILAIRLIIAIIKKAVKKKAAKKNASKQESESKEKQ